jgi:hypothetical protein
MHNPTLDPRSASAVRVMHRTFTSESIRFSCFFRSFVYMVLESVSGDETSKQS